MGFLYDILVFIVGFIIYVGGIIGLIVFMIAAFRWAIHVSKHDFDPFKGWWD